MAETSTRESVQLDGITFAKLLLDTVVEKKGSDILLLDVTAQTVFADYFLLCSAENRRQVRAVATSIREDAKHLAGRLPQVEEGEADGGWVVLDYGELIVHVFDETRRRYYQLEDLWQDAHTILRMQ